MAIASALHAPRRMRQSAIGIDMLPPTIPIFPLPNVVLFPNVFLPLHIFEPRYRQMVDDALNGDRIIGMVLLRPGWEAGLRRAAAGLSDRLRRRHHPRRTAPRRPLQHRPARHGEVPHRAKRDRQPIAWPASSRCPSRQRRGDRDEMRGRAAAPRALLVPQPDGQRPTPRFRRRCPTRIWSTRSRSTSSSKPVEKQALLERDGLLDRCRSLIELLEMKVLVARHRWSGDRLSGFDRLPALSACAGAGRYSNRMLLMMATGRPGMTTVSCPAACQRVERFSEQADLIHVRGDGDEHRLAPAGATALRLPGPAPPPIRSNSPRRCGIPFDRAAREEFPLHRQHADRPRGNARRPCRASFRPRSRDGARADRTSAFRSRVWPEA